ncbi:MAG: lamin tail domain-containing protein [Myxococcota bacterium]|nr:lamin tail domain-containing protein [Myxococcota bacterium]
MSEHRSRFLLLVASLPWSVLGCEFGLEPINNGGGDDTGPSGHHTGTTDTAIDPPEVGSLVISELMINPTTDDPGQGEWVEIYNSGTDPAYLAGLEISGPTPQESVQVPNTSSLSITPGSYAVLCRDDRIALNGGVQCDWGWNSAGLELDDSSDRVSIGYTIDGVPESYDQVNYDETSFGLTTGAATGVDLSALNPNSNDDPASWCNQDSLIGTDGDRGTPGARNDPC